MKIKYTRDQIISIGLKLSPFYQIRNPDMFVAYCGTLLLTGHDFYTHAYFTLGITLWLWATVLFSALAEAQLRKIKEKHKQRP